MLTQALLMTRTGAPLLRDPQGGGQWCGAQGWSHNQAPKADVQVWRLGGPALGSPSRMKVLLGLLGPELRSPEQETCWCPGPRGHRERGPAMLWAPGVSVGVGQLTLGDSRVSSEGSLGKRVGRNDCLLSTYCVHSTDS